MSESEAPESQTSFNQERKKYNREKNFAGSDFRLIFLAAAAGLEKLFITFSDI